MQIPAVLTPGVAVVESLKRKGLRLVLAESCTGGLAAGTLAQIPGVSEVLCGSFVVYQTAVKSHWLGISPQLLDDPAVGPVSRVVTEQLAIAALRLTPPATIAAAITGHLGPISASGGDRIRPADAADPPQAEADGQIHIALARRAEPSGSVAAGIRITSTRLAGRSPVDVGDYAARYERQCEAVERLFGELLRAIDEAS